MRGLRIASLTALLLAFCLLTQSALPQNGEAKPAQSWPQTLRNAASFPQQAQRYGLRFQYQCAHDLSSFPAGGPGERAWFARHTSTLSTTLDLHKRLGWTGASGYASLKQHVQEFGRNDDALSQGYSNIDATPHTALYEAWIQQQTLGEKLILKAGRIDANADFDATPTAAGFLNSSMGYSPTLMDFPTYPAPQPAVTLSAALSATRLAAGVFRTAAGPMSLVEGGRSWAGGPDQTGGRAAIGAWHLASRLTRPDGTVASGTSGWYGVLEQALSARPQTGSDAGKSPKIAAYLQGGTGDEQVNPYSGHLGGGIVVTGPLARRPADGAGIAASWVRTRPRKSETVIETYYKLSLSRQLSLVTDLQYFSNPGGRRTQTGALIVTPRLVITF